MITKKTFTSTHETHLHSEVKMSQFTSLTEQGIKKIAVEILKQRSKNVAEGTVQTILATGEGSRNDYGWFSDGTDTLDQ